MNELIAFAGEGAAVAFTSTVTDPDPSNGSNIDVAWIAQNPSGTPVGTGSGSTFSFTPADDGTYRVLLTATDHDDANRIYQDSVFVFVDNVAPAIEAGRCGIERGRNAHPHAQLC
jgi:hypothetical protein